jgi:16S rRNA (uracil1498-N3)-methyltransferase
LRRRFFVEVFAGGTACLTGDAAHHLGRVLRAEPGQLYELSDANSAFLARVERVSGNRIDFALLEKLPAARAPLDVSILLAIVKFDRYEWALEKATELGVNTIVPLAAERSEKALVSAAVKRAARWRKILLESAQQARCLRPPFLCEVTQPFAAFA